MDLFFNIDWQNLKNLMSDIETIAYNYHDEDSKDKIELTKLFYLVEKDLASVKKKLSLPNLNSLIDSEAVIESFAETPHDKDVFEKDYFIYDKFLRQNDYQYWLLIFLLLKNNHIRTTKLTLYQIIDQFIARVKDESFTWRDIEITPSGATRCKTNMRFAYNELKEVGLVYLYDKEQKQSWTLTFLGFFLAASFCLDPIEKVKKPLLRQITSFNQSNFYHRLNHFIWERIKIISNPEYFKYLIEDLALDNLGLYALENGPKLFDEYYDVVISLDKKYKSVKKKNEALTEYLNELHSRSSLTDYMTELSIKFDAEAFFSELMKRSNIK